MVRARASQVYNPSPHRPFPHSCARARTVASEVFTEAQSFADCKLHIRTRLLALAFSNFWKPFSLHLTLVAVKSTWLSAGVVIN